MIQDIGGNETSCECISRTDDVKGFAFEISSGYRQVLESMRNQDAFGTQCDTRRRNPVPPGLTEKASRSS